MRVRKNLLQILFGNHEDKMLEDQIPVVLSFATATLSLVASLLNIIIGLSPILIIIPLCAAVAMFFIYFKLRNSENKFLYKVWMAIVAFIYLNFLWFYNYASIGPNLYLFLIFFIFIIIIFEKKSRLVFSSLILLNILLLFMVEVYANDILSRYPDDKTRILDTYFSFILYLGFTLIMTLAIRYYFLLERGKARRSDQLKSAFLSNMSHEIRTPMSAILGFSKLLDYTDSETERNEYVQIINENGKMLMQLLDDIIDMSKLDAGQFDVYKSGFSLNSVMDELKKVLQLNLEQQKKYNIKLTLLTEPGDISVFTDENRFRQILYNLLSNAVKFTNEGEVSFGYKLEGNAVGFFVSDTGIGIKDQFKKEIFKRFYKVENSDYIRLPGGSGIGLSIVKLLVEKLGGNISFESEYGKGTTFRFVLPEVLLEKLPEPEVPISTIYVFSPRNTILAVDDDISNLMLIKNMLNKMGVTCIEAGNGQEAIDLYKQNKQINLVLLDLNMPVMSGSEALLELKTLNPALPVIALTAYAMQSDKEKAMAEGFDDYLTKPIYYQVLVSCLRKYLMLQAKASK